MPTGRGVRLIWYIRNKISLLILHHLSMKKSLPLVLILVYPFLAISNGFTIKGSVDGLQTGTATLAYQNEAGNDTTLAAAITAGNFFFADKVLEPETARLQISGDWSYNTTFFLENSNIAIHVVKDAPEKTLIKGSASNDVYEKLKPGLNEFFANARQNAAAHQQVTRPDNNRDLLSADSLWLAQQKAWMQKIEAAIKANPENYAALYFIQWLLFRPVNFDAIMALYMQLNPAVRNGLAAQNFMADYRRLYNTVSGQPAPEITGSDTAGSVVKLAAFKGKVVLLDFWASYCGPCRQENGRLLAIYQKYHAAGFEIVSFSLDNERSLWMKAIIADKLCWPQASDLRGGAGATANTYGITDLPRNVLIDKTGKIAARDLHGEDLIKALEQELKKDK